jgi:hypothetical protein
VEDLTVPMTGAQDQVSAAVIQAIAPEKILTVAVLQDHNMVPKTVTEAMAHLVLAATKALTAKVDGLVKVARVRDGLAKATQATARNMVKVAKVLNMVKARSMVKVDKVVGLAKVTQVNTVTQVVKEIQDNGLIKVMEVNMVIRDNKAILDRAHNMARVLNMAKAHNMVKVVKVRITAKALPANMVLQASGARVLPNTVKAQDNMAMAKNHVVTKVVNKVVAGKDRAVVSAAAAAIEIGSLFYSTLILK